MAKYILKRILYACATIFLVFTITFFLMNLVPGGPFVKEDLSPEIQARLEEKYGLNDPLYKQYFTYIKMYTHGDLGVSLAMKLDANINELIFNSGKFSVSMRLGLVTLIIIVVCGIPLGCLAAFNRGKIIDDTIRILSVLFTSMPRFVLSVFLLLIFTIKMKALPAVSGMLEEPKAWVMPIICMSLGQIFSTARLTRTSVLDVVGQDYIRTAKAKGCKNSVIMFKHAFRNALIPVITHFGPTIASLLLGSFIIENTFIIPGLGTYMTGAVQVKDYPVIMATTIIFSSVLITMNLLVDIAYTLADPRITFTSKGD
ncbi:MAG: ABC transporter permease [Lachnospiraceae bacterium]|nr:ABC transporter permease [Lachnospiraceae bacterium]